MAKKSTASFSYAGPVVYCGPTLPKGKLVTMSVFKGGLPAYVESLVEKNPDIGKLIVPVVALAETKAKIAVNGTEENRLSQAIMKAERGNENGAV